MSDHLQEAREFVERAENFSSPDDRGIPFALHGILHALIAIAERMPQPLTAEEYAELLRVQAEAAAAANPDTTVSESRGHQTEPIVRTVGDLTARHIGRRVRLDDYYDAELEAIFAHGGKVSLNFTHPEGFTYGCSRPLDTPCEVLS